MWESLLEKLGKLADQPTSKLLILISAVAFYFAIVAHAPGTPLTGPARFFMTLGGVMSFVLGLGWEINGKLSREILWLAVLGVILASLLYLLTMGTPRLYPLLDIIATVLLTFVVLGILVFTPPFAKVRLKDLRKLSSELAERSDAAKSAVGELKEQLLVLANERKQLVAQVEDATRSVLHGFPAIFRKSLDLVDEAEKELWMVNFAIRFGKPHLENTQLREDYKNDPSNPDHNSLEDDVDRFFSTLRARLGTTKLFNILTVTRAGAEANFLLPLSGETKYESLKDVTKRTTLIDGMEKDKSEMLNTSSQANIDRRTRWPGQKNYKLYSTSSLPIQLLIAGRPNGKLGCLVFMVGTESLRGRATRGRSGGEQPTVGFYTELDEVVTVYRNLAESLMSQPLPEDQCRDLC